MVEEIRKAIKKLNLVTRDLGSAGDSIEFDQSVVVRRVVIEFLESEAIPLQWEDGLLKVLPKSGDLSQPGNYRGIMLLEVLYNKIITNIIPRGKRGQ